MGTERNMRMDFTKEITGRDEDTGTFSYVLVPNRERYELRDVDGRKLWYDRLDKLFLPENILQQVADFMRSTQPYMQPPLVNDVTSYVQGRRAAIRESLNGLQLQLDAHRDTSREFLDNVLSTEHEFVIMSVDLVGSTKMSTSLPEGQYVSLVRTILHELAELVPLFRGHILKFTGDGIIAFFPAPSFITKNDLAIDCAFAILAVIKDAVNFELSSLGRAIVDVRIGMDSGSASVVPVGSSASTQQTDIIGHVVSLACKIQSKAPINGIGIGESTLQNLHTTRRKQFDELNPIDLEFINPSTGSRYRMYATVGD